MKTTWWHNRIVIAILGALALGVLSAVIAMQQVPAVAGMQTALQQGKAATHGVATPTHPPKHDPTRTPTNVPTGTSTVTPTTPPTGTATPTSQTVTLMGQVTTIESTQQQFVLQPDSGGTLRVRTNSTTHFGGSLRVFGDLRMNTRVQVIGMRQTDGSLLASSITSQQDD